ncbi:aldolase/citrate lyase family protein [soil metagenome]
MRPTALARSYLFVPGDNTHLLEKVFSAGADAVVLDLEDAVQFSQKEQARSTVGEFLHRRLPHRKPLIYVRINPVASPHWKADLQSVFGPVLSGIRLAKAESSSDVAAVDEWLTSAERAAGLRSGSIALMPTIESAAGLLAAKSMAHCERVQSFCFGATDFANDIGADPGPMGIELLYAQSQLVLISRITRVRPPVASVYTSISDLEGLRATSEALRRLGYFGRSCIHPKQLQVVHEIFTPSAQQIAHAQSIVQAYEVGTAKGLGSVATSEGQLVDQAIVERAKQILSLADLLGVAQHKEAS